MQGDGRSLPVLPMLLALGLLGARPAEALLIQLDYAGVAPVIGAELAGGPIVDGAVVVGSLVYDTETPEAAFSVGLPELGAFNGAIVSHEITVGPYSASVVPGGGGRVDVSNDFNGNGDSFIANVALASLLSGDAINGLSPTRLQFALASVEDDRLFSDQLPLPADLLAAFSPADGSTTFNALTFGNNPANVRFFLTSFTASVVPEPTVGALLAFAAVLGVWHRHG